MNKSNLTSKLILGTLVFSMATSQVSATDGAWEDVVSLLKSAPMESSVAGTPVSELAPNLSLPDAPATVGRLDSLKAFSGNAWNATKQYAGNAWDATKTYSGKAWDKTQPVRQYVKMPESKLGKAGLAFGLTTAGLVGAGLVWKRYNKNAAPKVEVPVKAEAPAQEPAVVAVVSKVAKIAAFQADEQYKQLAETDVNAIVANLTSTDKTTRDTATVQLNKYLGSFLKLYQKHDVDTNNWRNALDANTKAKVELVTEKRQVSIGTLAQVLSA